MIRKDLPKQGTKDRELWRSRVSLGLGISTLYIYTHFAPMILKSNIEYQCFNSEFLYTRMSKKCFVINLTESVHDSGIWLSFWSRNFVSLSHLAIGCSFC